MQVTFDISLDELGRIVSLLKKWRKAKPYGLHATQQEVELFRRSPIDAIRVVRNRTGCTLKEAKDLLVEAAK